MSENAMFKLGLYARLERIAEEAFELFKQRREIEGWLDGDTSISFISDLELKWLKAQYHALGEALDALGKQREAIKVVLDNPNVFDKHEASDKTDLITKLKDEEYELSDKLNKLSTFLLDSDKTAQINDEQLRLLQMQQQAMANYHRILVARIFNLETDKGE
ncbi:hypothetical protein LBLM1_11230 (plasmid) [Limosilactobacillus mucosae LM1]|uniref:Uncharacterized protein n=1 Tax=Limosilactobacillus mucosae LM1 TaxID=1130798 RepID=A0A0D4CN97_LIMMU|nr:hypothetical protein [Limosilactobacillus mucosae]AJT51592.1 hypothetical protein LBLM1_11230 [Limosilactobacillus mucosae LM1]